jgi:hypothetical protein
VLVEDRRNHIDVYGVIVKYLASVHFAATKPNARYRSRRNSDSRK